MMKRREALFAAGVGTVATLLGAGLAWRWTGPARQQAAAVGSPGRADDELSALWSARFARPEGGELQMAALRGKPLLINFWATWCAPCVKEMPDLDRFYQSFAPQGGQLLGLAIDGPTPVREFLLKRPVSFPIGLAGLEGGDLARALGNPQGSLPFSVLIDRTGKPLWRKLGASNYDELTAKAAEWLR